MKYTLLVALLLASCGDTGCELEEERIRIWTGTNYVYQTCYIETCKNSDRIEKTCRNN